MNRGREEEEGVRVGAGGVKWEEPVGSHGTLRAFEIGGVSLGKRVAAKRSGYLK